MNKLRRIFCPTKEEEIEDYERILQIHKNNIGECCTCIHRIPTDPYLPGFVTDYGKCMWEMFHFEDKVCRLRKIECEHYEENVKTVMLFEELIHRLKGDDMSCTLIF